MFKKILLSSLLVFILPTRPMENQPVVSRGYARLAALVGPSGALSILEDQKQRGIPPVRPIERKQPNQPASRGYDRLGQILGNLGVPLAMDEKEVGGEGIASGTLVHTIKGPKRIEDVVIGDKLVSYDRLTDKRKESTVIRRRQKALKKYVRLQTGDGAPIEMNGEQRLLDDTREWQHACELDEGDALYTYNGDTLPVSEWKCVEEPKMVHALSLHGPRNFVVGPQKLIAHNEFFTLATLTAVATGIRFASYAFEVGTMSWGAWKSRGAAKHAIFDDINKFIKASEANQAMGSVTIGDMIKSNADKKTNFPPEILVQLGERFGVNTALKEIPADQLKDVAQALNVPAEMVSVLTDTATIAGAVPGAVAGAVAVSTVGTIVQGVGGSAYEGSQAGLAKGVVNVGLGLLSGNVCSFGQVFVILGTSVSQGAIGKVAIDGTKAGVVAAAEKYAPELTKKIAVYIPGIGTAYMVCEAGWSLYKMGKGIKGWFSGAPTVAVPTTDYEAIQKKVDERIHSEAGIKNGELAKMHWERVKKKIQAAKEAKDAVDKVGSAGGAPGGPDKPPRNTDWFGNMKEFFAKAPIGPTLKAVSKKTRDKAGNVVYELTDKLPQYGMKFGDQYYLDMLHRNHLEVFQKGGRVVRTVLNFDGTTNWSKLAQALKQVRRI